MQWGKWAACLLAAVLLAVSVRAAVAQAAWPGLKSAEPVAIRLTNAEEPASGDFDLRLRYRTATGKGWQAVVLFDRQDDANTYRLMLSPTQATLSRIHLGLDLPLATGTGPGAGRQGELLVRRRGTCIRLFHNGRLMLTGYDEAFDEGGVAYGASGDRFAFDDVLLQPVQPIAFSDDFMRSEEEQGDWEPVSGKWQVKSLQNAIRSPNAFTYLGAGGRSPGISLAGHWFWSDYHFGAAVMGEGMGAIGLAASYQPDGSYILFEWTGRGGGSVGARRLVSVQQGKRRGLAESKGGYRPGQWYDVSIAVRGGTVQAFIDGSLVCECKTALTPGGRAGLYVADGKGAFFDDVWCASNRDVIADFTVPGDLAAVSRGAWRSVGGQWATIRSGPEVVCEGRTASPARALVGSPSWADYTVSADVGLTPMGSAGLCLYYQDEGDYLVLRTSQANLNVIELVKAERGKESVVESAPAPPPAGLYRRLTARGDRGLIAAYADGRRLFETYDPNLTGGRAGLYAESSPTALFDNFILCFTPRERAPVFTAHEVFSGEVSMEKWAAAQSDWSTVKAKLDVGEAECRWHRAPFFGDVEVEAEVAPARGALGIAVAAPEQTPTSGYLLTLSGGSLLLSRAGAPVARADLKANVEKATIRLRKEGGILIATVDGASRLYYHDPQPLGGVNVGWYDLNGAVNLKSVNVYSDNAITDTFRQAPADWRSAGGTWEVTKRWQCDPRWSFFSGYNPKGAAVLWHKRPFDGDVTVEFAAGIKMTREHGSYKDYGRDVNLTLCADGSNADSGYTFVFAGWGNKKNAIVRQGKVVAEAPPPKLDDSIHRYWFLIRAEKRGGHLRYFVDDKLVCEYHDPQPLSGGRLALWTYRCGMMVSRFRASAEQIGPREPVEKPWPAASRTFYDR